jgi:hypothetical protein
MPPNDATQRRIDFGCALAIVSLVALFLTPWWLPWPWAILVFALFVVGLYVARKNGTDDEFLWSPWFWWWW